eukprot:713787-Alexandrium_andersonii.AAC.1
MDQLGLLGVILFDFDANTAAWLGGRGSVWLAVLRATSSSAQASIERPGRLLGAKAAARSALPAPSS